MKHTYYGRIPQIINKKYGKSSIVILTLAETMA